MNTLKAGAAYFAAVFAVGFILGAGRVMMLEPALGPVFAVLLELPIMLTASWLLCAWFIRQFRIQATFYARFFMGLTAFILLMAAEFALAHYGFGRSGADQLQALATPSGAFGLTGQILFALFPLMQIVTHKDRNA